LQEFKDKDQSVQLIKINKDVLLNGATSFLFNNDNQHQTIEINRSTLKEESDDIKVWQGHSVDDKSTAVFSIKNNKVSGFVKLSDHSAYEIHPISEELHALVRIETAGGDENEFDYIQDDSVEPGLWEHDEQSSNEIAKIRVLYAYTNQSRYKFGNSPELYASTLNTSLNSSHVRSNSLARFDVAGTLDTNVTEHE
jgi:hypothetical protein